MKKLSTFFAVASLATATSLGAPTATAIEASKQEKPKSEAKVNAIPAIAAAGDKNYIPRQFERSAMEARSYRVHDSRDPRRKTNSGKTGKIPAYTTQVLGLSQYNQEPHEQASAYVLNITAINPESNGFITVWHGRGVRPSTSSVNYTAGQVIANQVHVKADPAADETYISVYSHATTHYVVDLVGRYTTGREHFVPIAPARVHDSRAGGAPKPEGRTTTIRPLGTVAKPEKNRGSSRKRHHCRPRSTRIRHSLAHRNTAHRIKRELQRRLPDQQPGDYQSRLGRDIQNLHP